MLPCSGFERGYDAVKKLQTHSFVVIFHIRECGWRQTSTYSKAELWWVAKELWLIEGSQGSKIKAIPWLDIFLLQEGFQTLSEEYLE